MAGFSSPRVVKLEKNETQRAKHTRMCSSASEKGDALLDSCKKRRPWSRELVLFRSDLEVLNLMCVARTSTINRVELRKKESKEATRSEAEKDGRRRKNQGGWSAATLDLQMTS